MNYNEGDRIKELFRLLLSEIGEDPQRPELLKTPVRYISALKELCTGYSGNPEETLKEAVFHHETSQLVVVKEIEFYSLCEHHLLPFFGKVHVGYIPDGKIVGLSKIPSVVRAFSRRLQVQERLTGQIAGCLDRVLAPKGAACLIEARHLCLMMRGGQARSGLMVTSALKGELLKDTSKKEEFFRIIGAKNG